MVGLPVVYFDLTTVKSGSQLPDEKGAEETTVILSRRGSASALVRLAIERLSPDKHSGTIVSVPKGSLVLWRGMQST